MIGSFSEAILRGRRDVRDQARLPTEKPNAVLDALRAAGAGTEPGFRSTSK